MDGNMAAFKRGVIIFHDEFQGETGLQSATSYAQQLSSGAVQLIEQAKKAGDQKVVDQMTAYLKGFRYLVRDIPPGVEK